MNIIITITGIAICLTVVTATKNTCTTDITGTTLEVPRETTEPTFITVCTFCWCNKESDTAMCNSIDCPEWFGHTCPYGQSFHDVPGKCCRELLLDSIYSMAKSEK